MCACNGYRWCNCDYQGEWFGKFGICEKIFFPLDKSIKLTDQKGFTIVFGDIRSGEEIVDEVL